ncbi:MAG: aminotransferase class I/II-fold pyridoxal phosphate-dependent enzyme [Rhizonema sp. NSF051]|nr:aminotransferase class I/II-fold pyridoxal phosphate-dependent enzyme [Rhizonema sp. NSF051]
MLNQNQTPLLDTLKACAAHPHAPFYTPGHKQGQGISQPLADLFGKAVFRADLPELDELDNLFAPQGVIQQAQQLAAEAFGAARTWFLVNGSTCGVEAAILATCGMGDKIILPRNVHSSAIAGLILSGALPIFINPEYNPVLDIAHSLTPNSVETALEQHPDAKAVMMVYPTYYGACGDVSAIASLTHQYNIPLLVDEAHGAHFAFHPQLPTSALAAGADLTVQSIHKVLGALTQASMLHIQGNRIKSDRISKALQLVQSTSPSYLLLASLDAARQQMALYGKELMSRTLQLADAARTRISQIPGLSVLDIGITPAPCLNSLEMRTTALAPRLGSNQGSGFVALDITRLTVTVSGLGLTGFEADEILNEQLGITAELPSLQHLTFIISLGNTQEDIDRLVEGFTILAQEYCQILPPHPSAENRIATFKTLVDDDFSNIVENTRRISPRVAFFADTETVALTKAYDRICAEIICPYPPGIPVLMPGEAISKATVDYLQHIQAMGGFISGCADNTLHTIKVVRS